jgi:hypothetical protein
MTEGRRATGPVSGDLRPSDFFRHGAFDIGIFSQALSFSGVREGEGRGVSPTCSDETRPAYAPTLTKKPLHTQ